MIIVIHLPISPKYMLRCLKLAEKAAGHVAPNPMVGAVLVFEDRIIGEGFHKQFGKPHAEVNCINSVVADDVHLISASTLYVSLEPCVHHGKTPPCTDLIISKKIQEVVIGCKDPFPEVSGKGILKLKHAGVAVHTGVMEKECIIMNKRFIYFQTLHKPYVILKWAQTANAKISSSDPAQKNISNEFTRRLVHKWRSEEASILVGTNTANLDDPELTNRYWHGGNPTRLIIDMDLKLPSSLKIFNGQVPTIIFNTIRNEKNKNVSYYQVTTDVSLTDQILNALHQMKILSVFVEGGARLLQTFIDQNSWDEIRLITNTSLWFNEGLASPEFKGKKVAEEYIFDDRIEIFKPD